MNEADSFQGPTTYYFRRTLRFKRDTVLGINIGHTDSFKVYLNGEILCERYGVQNWTPENVLIFRLCKRCGNAKFSFTLLENGPFTPVYVHSNSKIEQ